MIPNRIVAIGTSSFFGIGDNGNGGFIGRFKNIYTTFEKNLYGRIFQELKKSLEELYN